uniref:Secreted protein n=1 Tax=Bradyrhizobium amphicarpaeae TaxID=1404768 RepID=A0A2U8PT42_9BRAD|nr:hypothetical protein CIT40_13585 [Bradyrhizobium amphicarpaeae]
MSAMIAMCVVLVFPHTAAHAISWQDGNGVSCKVSCASKGGAIDSGIYKGDPDKPLYVCAANAGGKGKRPGYNLAAAAGANKCVVGYDFREVAVGTFDCLCKN